MSHEQRGFTLVELLVYIILVSMFTTIVIKAMLDYWSGAATLVNDNETFVQREDAGDTLRTYLNLGSALVNQNSVTDAHPAVGDPADSTGTYWKLIHAIPGSTTMPTSGAYAPVFYFSAPSVDTSKNFIMNGTQPYYDDFMLYMNGSTKQLLMRKLINPGASSDRLKTTCPSAFVTTACPADIVVSDDVSSVDTSYYSKSDIAIDYTSSTDPLTGQYNGPDFANAEVVSITVHLSRRSVIRGGTPTTNQIVVRVALRN
jgi:prepilin-type N-terminal cleavage/methylation domain-containing protein